MTPYIVLFDGECSLCSRSVQFVVDRDPRQRFRFAPLQSETGRELLQRFSLGDDLSSVVLVEGERCFLRSTAALRIARRLRGLWPLLYALIIVPRPLRDAIYDWIAANRHRLLGGKTECRLPTD
ncbi:MAG: DCC1-like thiol-disulfide oxidoreductase family protein [Planctomycetota bacterium]|nr:DCC1-like thiol-disulfide oxidoreductase family protein [Planctomycetota bacterium]